MAKCTVCGKEVKEGQYKIEMGEVVCKECMLGTVRCDECMERKAHEDTISITEGRLTYYICKSCIEEATEVCPHCGQRHIKEYMFDVVAGKNVVQRWCKDCRDSHATYCSGCRRYTVRELAEEDYDGNMICPNCRPNYIRCEECGRLAPKERAVEVEDDDSNETRLLCQRCDRELSNERTIHDYGFKPAPSFKHIEGATTRERANQFYGGVELEIGTGGENHRKAKSVLKALANQEAYAKHDGSVESGFEIVTHPCTLEYHRQMFGWKELCHKALSLGYRGHDNQSCGMHVHINRKFLGSTPEEIDETVSKMILFVENNWSDVVKFSRREPTRINQWAGNYSSRRPIENCSDKKEKCKKLIDQAKYQGDRRRAVNITNDKTIEFRLFRSTLKSNTIIANIEFCYLIAHCSKKWDYNTCENAKFGNIKQEANELGFNEFITYCEERGM